MQDDSDNHDETDDAELFSRMMQGVKPLDASNRVSQQKKPKKTVIRPDNAPGNNETGHHADYYVEYPIDEITTQDVPEVLCFSRPGIQRSKLAKLRQGKLHIEERIDLHGLTVQQAGHYLTQFLAECKQHHITVICIVHGKGNRSKNKLPIIKAMLNRWLRDTPQVLAFHSAPRSDGGTGALYVLLKK